MSQQLISRSFDLKRLRDEGYEVAIRSGYLLISHVPYMDTAKEVRLGTLVSKLCLAGDTTTTPDNHVAYFIGNHPCNKDGSEIAQIKHQSSQQVLGDKVVVQHSFSNRPPGGYPDYYAKMTTYIGIISAPARSFNDTVTAQTFQAIEPEEEDSVFTYLDTASSRAEINTISDKLKGLKIAIVGLGGTGGYVLDLVAKTPVREIHLFDGDQFAQHNAFRAPGAASIEELREKLPKTEYFKRIYSKMHKYIFSHPGFLDPSNVAQLSGMDFVFVCIDRGSIKESLYSELEARDIPFIDVGMGVHAEAGELLGIVRTTLSARAKRQHVRRRVSFADGADDDRYSTDIQIADLNMLNAAFAVVRWKKLYGFYQDLENENSCTYSLNVNMLLSEDQ